MKLERGQAALITGGGGGIGRALAVALANRGVQVSVLDLVPAQGQETVRAVEAEHARISYKPSTSAIFIRCDVTNSGELTAAFAQHQSVFGRLDICINNAGVVERGRFYEDDMDWRKVMDINLTAVIEGTKLAIQAMKGRGGQILNTASAAGLYPMPFGPLYSSSKGGVVMFTRALKPLKKLGIRANVLCPEFIQTPFLEAIPPAEMKLVNSVGYVTMERVLEAAFWLLDDERQSAACVWVPADKPTQFWPTPEEEQKYRTILLKKPQTTAALAVPPPIPSQFQKLVVHTLSSNFRAATRVVTVNYKPPITPGHVLIKYLYVGINASDINFSAGRYHSSPKEAAAGLPLDCGFEAVGLIAGVGENVSRSDLKPGSPAATVTFGGFSEYRQVPAKHVFSVPAATPEVVAMLTSGLTASIGLEQAGRMKSGETVLVTAAAGGTGQFAVQLAKIAGNKVVATCGGADKARLLRDLGVDRVIDYRKETVKEVLKKEYPKGVNLVYESVGGAMFDTCIKALAVFGRMVVIGMISQYTEGEGGEWKPAQYPGLCEQLLWKSQTVSGFFLVHYSKMYQEHIGKLYNLYSSGKLKILIDPTKFQGVHSVANAVEHLHSGKSLGKVVVQLASSQPASRL